MESPNAVTNAIGYAQFYSRSADAVIPVYDAAVNVIEVDEYKATSKRNEVPFAAPAGY